MRNRNSQTYVLVVGDRARADARFALDPLADDYALRSAPSIKSAIALLRESRTTPDLIVLLAEHPGQYAEPDVNALRRAAPLAAVTTVLGSWCEGEERSGAPTRGVRRLYWHAFGERMRGATTAQAAGATPTWSMPDTATEAERIELESRRSFDGDEIWVVARSEDRASRECLADLCRSAGLACVEEWGAGQATPGGRGGAALFDSRVFDLAEQVKLARFAERVTPAPVILLGNFIRHQDFTAARRCGAAYVVSKPYRAADLVSTIRAAASRMARIRQAPRRRDAAA